MEFWKKRGGKMNKREVIKKEREEEIRKILKDEGINGCLVKSKCYYYFFPQGIEYENVSFRAKEIRIHIS